MRITGDVRSTAFYSVAAIIFVIHAHMNHSELEGTIELFNKVFDGIVYCLVASGRQDEDHLHKLYSHCVSWIFIPK